MAVGTGVCVADGVAVLSLLQPVSMDSIKAPAKAAEIISVNISVKYGQTEARKIFDMINEARTNREYTWYWNMDDITKTFCKNSRYGQSKWNHLQGNCYISKCV